MSRQRGFTLIELMVVVAIIGILATLAFDALGEDSDPRHEATAAAQMLREASRKAIAGGPVRDDVAFANELAERARVSISSTATGAALVLERVEERALPDSGFEWVELRRHDVDLDIELYGYADATALEPGSVTPIPLPSGEEVTVACFPDGRCEPKTLFFRDRRSDTRRVRVVVMPCNGNPLVFDDW